MADHFLADEGALAAAAAGLRRGADSLNDLAGSVPAAPDAGPLSGEMAGLLSKQVGAAGEYAVGVAAASQAVAEGGQAYQRADDSARQSFVRPR